MDKTEIERLIVVEQKLDRNTKIITRLEKNQGALDEKLDKTHDAVVSLPEELQTKFVTRLEFAAVKWVAGLVAVILGILSFRL